MTEPMHLSLSPYSPNALPQPDDIIAAAKTLLENSDREDWVEGKTYPRSVRTFTRAQRLEDGAPWHMRVSVHTKEEGTFDQFWNGLGKNHAENEMQFVTELKKVTRIMDVSDSQSIWSMFYKFTPPVSPRVFTELQTFHLVEESPLTRTGMIVSLPVDLAGDKQLAEKEEFGVKGRYVSVERIQELADGRVEWRMATSSTPAGRIPKFLTEYSMAKSIASDVPRFLDYIHKST